MDRALLMRIALLILFITLPLVEIAVLVRFGQWAGLWPTLAIVIGTAIAGAVVIQRQGLNVFLRMQQSMMRGEPPVGAMLDGVMLAMAGTLLITPGLIADVTGVLLLLPPVRHAATRWLARAFFGTADIDVRVDTFETRSEERRAPGGQPQPPPGDGPVIEGEFERLDERTVDPGRRSGPRR